MLKRMCLSAAIMAACSGFASANDTCETSASESVSLSDTIIAEAQTLGEDCANSVAIVIVRNGDGRPVYSFSSPAHSLFELEYATNGKEMATALDTMIGVPNREATFSSNTLPPWQEGADGPEGEFPFYLEDWMDRTEYERIRASDTPIWCHVQGIESMACFTVENENIFSIGVQAFPG